MYTLECLVTWSIWDISADWWIDGRANKLVTRLDTNMFFCRFIYAAHSADSGSDMKPKTPCGEAWCVSNSRETLLFEKSIVSPFTRNQFHKWNNHLETNKFIVNFMCTFQSWTLLFIEPQTSRFLTGTTLVLRIITSAFRWGVLSFLSILSSVHNTTARRLKSAIARTGSICAVTRIPLA